MKIGDLVTVNVPSTFMVDHCLKEKPKKVYLVTDTVDRGTDWRGRLILCKCRATWDNAQHPIVWKWTYDLEVVR